jgi:hypothetical protein
LRLGSFFIGSVKLFHQPRFLSGGGIAMYDFFPGGLVQRAYGLNYSGLGILAFFTGYQFLGFGNVGPGAASDSLIAFRFPGG